jgi:Flp pilus assembly pilin Flp
MNLIRAFIQDNRAATTIEYALIAAGISVVIEGLANVLAGRPER